MAWILDKLFGADELEATGAAADAKLAEMNAKDYGPGGKFYSASNWAVVQQNLETSVTGDVSAQLDAAFDEGWEEGKANVSGTIKGTFGIAGDVLTSVLKGIPWWVWALVLGYFLWPILAPKLIKKLA